MKKALVTGITGQDGSFLAELLLSKGYEVHGIVRRASTFNTDRLDHIYTDPHERDARLYLHYGDVADGGGLRLIMKTVLPDEIYNLGAQSHVRVSFDQAEYTADVVATGTLRMLEALRDVVQFSGKQIKFYQAGSSEMFGSSAPPQNESTPFSPRSPYAVSKVAAHWFCLNYREAYGLFISNGILFNHESERRGETFVTRKVTRAFTRIKLGLQKKLFLGNLNAKRDWGYAGDYVDAMWRMLQRETPGDYVVATGKAHSILQLLELAGRYCGIDWTRYVESDSRYLRPTEVDFLLGDPSKAHSELGWKPTVNFEKLIRIMVDHDLELAWQEKTLAEAGYRVAARGAAHA
jgi:GDPmannose 4,6-dehydratase